jgi:hypothetical protein
MRTRDVLVKFSSQNKKCLFFSRYKKKKLCQEGNIYVVSKLHEHLTSGLTQVTLSLFGYSARTVRSLSAEKRSPLATFCNFTRPFQHQFSVVNISPLADSASAHFSDFHSRFASFRCCSVIPLGQLPSIECGAISSQSVT